MRFLVDMPLSPGLAVWLAGQGHDAVHAADVGLASAADTIVMERAE
jgi:predicted nuclease of predicted toxin-antitoxin system